MSRDERRAARARQIREHLGEAPAKQSYAEWLRSQPTSVQDEALGRRRAQLWREGNLTIERFIEPPGRPLSLKDLAARRPEGTDDP